MAILRVELQKKLQKGTEWTQSPTLGKSFWDLMPRPLEKLVVEGTQSSQDYGSFSDLQADSECGDCQVKLHHPQNVGAQLVWVGRVGTEICSDSWSMKQEHSGNGDVNLVKCSIMVAEFRWSAYLSRTPGLTEGGEDIQDLIPQEKRYGKI